MTSAAVIFIIVGNVWLAGAFVAPYSNRTLVSLLIGAAFLLLGAFLS